MTTHGYPEVAQHAAEHRALTEKVLSFQADFESGKALMTVQVLQFLRDWLSHHIAESDTKYAPFLQQHAVR